MHAISVVARKDVMKIVIALAIGEQSHKSVVPRRGVMGVGLRTPHVRERIDAKRHMMANNQA
jgi:hypothetical protein